MNDANKQAVRELIADALVALHEHPSYWCTEHGFGQVAAELRKPPRSNPMSTDIEDIMDERIARAFGFFAEHAGPADCGIRCEMAREVAAKLRKSKVTRRVITFTQVSDLPRCPKIGEYGLDGHYIFYADHDYTESGYLIFTRKDSTDYGKLH